MQLKNMHQGEAFTSNRLKGYSVVADGNTPYGARRVRYMVIHRGDIAYIFAGTAKSRSNPRKYDAAILATAKSLRPLTAAEKKLAAGRKLDIIRAKAGVTYSGLARQSSIANYPEEQLRLLNDQYPQGEPRASQLLKIVR
jgi:predicted Zn-dependent protease